MNKLGIESDAEIAYASFNAGDIALLLYKEENGLCITTRELRERSTQLPLLQPMAACGKP